MRRRNWELLIALAQTNNFELRLRATELEQQGFRVALAKNERFPTISIGPSISEERRASVSELSALGSPCRCRFGIEIAATLKRPGRASPRRKYRSPFYGARSSERWRKPASSTRRKSARFENGPIPSSIFARPPSSADRHYRLGAVPIATYVELQKQYLDAVESLLDTRKEALEAAGRTRVADGVGAAADQLSSAGGNKIDNFPLLSILLIASPPVALVKAARPMSSFRPRRAHFSAKNGLLLPEETQRSLGLKLVEVAEQPIESWISFPVASIDRFRRGPCQRGSLTRRSKAVESRSTC